MIKTVSDILHESAELDKDILDIMDESVPAFEYTSTGLDTNYLEGENFISEAYADLMSYKAQANEILVESMGNMNEASIGEMRRMIDETLASKAQSIGFKVAQLFRALAKKIRVAILGGQLKTISRMLPKLKSTGVDLSLADANCRMADAVIDTAVKCIQNNGNKPADEVFEALAKGLDDVVGKINALKLDDFMGEKAYDMNESLKNHVSYAKDLIKAFEKWASAAIATSSAEDAANARRVSSSLNKIVTVYLKCISACLKAIRDAASKSGAAKKDDDNNGAKQAAED